MGILNKAHKQFCLFFKVQKLYNYKDSVYVTLTSFKNSKKILIVGTAFSHEKRDTTIYDLVDTF